MKIKVRIYNSEGHTRSVDVPTGKKITTFITPEEGKFNYELIDLDTGVGPQSIVAKRQGNDLAIAFENADQPDLIFENYYADEEPSLIIGLSEDGSYYAYIPESGMGADAIPNLNESVLASEVLGGERIGATPVVFPYWKGVLGGIAAIGAAAAVATVASGSKSRKLKIKPAEKAKENPAERVLPTPDVRVSADKKYIEISVPTKETETGDKLVINVVEKGHTKPTKVELTRNKDGSWTSNNEELVPSVPAPKADKNGKLPTETVVKIDASKVELGQDVTAVIVDKNGKSGRTDQDVINEEETDPVPPSVKPLSNGDVKVTVPSNLKAGDEVVVQLVERGNYEKDQDGNIRYGEDGNPIGIKTIVTLVKQADGSFVSSKPDLVPSIPAGQDSTTIDGSKIEPGSTVDAKTQTKTGKVSSEVSEPVVVPDDIAPNDPIVTAKAKGAMEVALPNALDANDNKLEISVLETGKTERTTVTLTKDASGNWVSSNPELVPSIPAGAKATLIAGDKIDDKAEVKAQLFDSAKNSSNVVAGVPDNTPPPAPTVTPKENGKVEIEVPQNKTEAGDKLKITVQEPDKNEPTTVTLTKQQDGSWKSDNPTIAPDIPAKPDTNGKFKTEIDGAYIKPGTEVKAIIEDNAGNTGVEEKAEPDTVIPDAPTVTPNEDGSVTVTLPKSAADAKKGSKLEVTVTRPDGSTEKVTLTADGEGNWTSDKPSIVPSISAGSANTTIPADQIKPGSDVKAQIIGPTGNKGSIGTEKAIEPDLTPPTKPEVIANKDGSVDVKVPENAKPGDKVVVTITKPGEKPQTETLTKQDDDSWLSSNPAVLPNISDNNNISTIPASQLPPNTEVKAETISKAGIPSAPAKDNAVEPEVSPAPEAATDPSQPGAVVITPKEGNTEITVKFKNEQGGNETLVIKKENDEWVVTTQPSVPVRVDAKTGIIKILPDSILDGSNGTIIGKNGNQPVSAPETFTAGQDAPSNPPTVSAGTQPGSVTVTPGEGNTEMTVKYTDEKEVPHTIKAVKDPETGRWTITTEPQDSGVSIDPTTGKITIEPNSLKDNSAVIATGKSGNNPESPLTNVNTAVAGSDTQSSTPDLKPGEKQGSVVATPAAGNTRMTVNYTNEAETDKTITINKVGDKWVVDQSTPLPNGVSLDANSGKLTFEPNAVKDESLVTAIGENGNNPASSPARLSAPEDTQSAQPTLVPGEESGSAVAMPGEGNTAMYFIFTDEDGKDREVMAYKDPENGNQWRLLNTDDTPIEGIRIDPTTGKVSFSPDALKDSTSVTVVGVAGVDPASEPLTILAGKDAPSKQPSVEVKDDGSMVFKPADGNTEMTIIFDDEQDARQTVKVEVEKNGDGKWVPTFNLPADVKLDPNTGAVTLLPNAVKDESKVRATAKSGNNPESAELSVDSKADTLSPAPTVEKIAKPAGGMKITPAEGNTKVIVSFTNEAEVPKNVTIEINKNAAGQWASTQPLPKDVVLDRDTGVITLKPDSVQDLSKVEAQGKSGNDPLSAKVEATTDRDEPSKPATIKHGAQPGSVEITPNPENTKLTVGFKDENNADRIVTLVKDPVSGKWAPEGGDSSLPKGVGYDADTGKVTLAPDAVLDGQPVSAETRTGNNPATRYPDLTPGSSDQPFLAGTDPVSPAPSVVEGTKPGSVDVLPAQGNTKVTVGFTGEDNKPKTVVAEKDPNTGTWSLKEPTVDGVSINPTTGRITIEPNAIKDGTAVTATGQNGNDPVSVVDPAAPKFVAPTDARSEKPSVGAGKEPGSMEATPNPENTKMTVEYQDEAGNPVKFVIEKNDNGEWAVTEGTKPDAVILNPETGKVLIPADSIADREPLKVTTQSGDNPPAETVSEPAGVDTASAAPEVRAGNTQGSVTIKPDTSNDKLTVTFQDESEPAVGVTVKAEKGPNGWAIVGTAPKDVSIDKDTGTITLAPNAVKDGSEVRATAKTGNNPESAVAKGTAATDPQSGVPVATRGEEAGSLVVHPAEGNTKVTVEFTGEDNQPKKVVAEKDPQTGTWRATETEPATLAGVEVKPNGEIVISPDAIKDNTTATVTGQNGNDPASTTTTTTTTTDAPSQPVKTIAEGSEPGSVVITPEVGNTEVTVKFKDESEPAQDKEVTAKQDPVTKKWSLSPATEGVSVDPNTGVITLQPNAVADNTPVKVSAKSGENPSSPELTFMAGQDATSPKPLIAKNEQDQGGILVTPVEGNTKLTVHYTTEENTNAEVVATKQNGRWTITSPNPAPKGVSVDPDSGVITLSPNSVRDETEVYATANNGNNPTSEDAKVSSAKDPRSAQPTIEPSTESQGAMVVKPADSNTRVEIDYTDEKEKPVSFVVVKGADDRWVAEDPTKVPQGTVIDPVSGKVTLPANNVFDGKNVFAVGQDGNNDKSEAKSVAAALDGTSEKPTVVEGQGENAGSITVQPHTENTRLVIEYTTEDGQNRTVDVEKVNPDDPNSLWKPKLALPDNIQLNERTGEVTFPADSLKDNSPIKIQGQDGNDPLSGAVTGPNGEPLMAKNDPQSNKPNVVKGDEEGSAKVTPGAGNTKVIVTFKPEDGPEATIEINKDPLSGRWSPTTVLPKGVTMPDTESGVLLFGKDALEDNSTLTAKGQKGKDPISEPQPFAVGEDPASPQPHVEAGEEQGSVVIRPAEGNTTVKFRFFNEEGNEIQEDIVATLNPVNNRWSIGNDLNSYALSDGKNITINPLTGEITIPADLLKDNDASKPVTVIGKNGRDPDSEPKTFTPSEDAPSDKPQLQPGQEPGSMVATPHKNNTKMTVTIVKNDGTPVDIVVSKPDTPNAVWGLSTLPQGIQNSDVKLDTATGRLEIKNSAIKDYSDVKARGENGNNPPSTEVKATAGNDNASPAASVVAINDGSEMQGAVEITPHSSNDKLNVIFQDENKEMKEFRVVKDPQTNKWRAETSTPAEVELNADTGKVTLKPNAVLDESIVSATSTTNGKDPSAPVTVMAEVDKRSPQPEIADGTEEGSVTVTPNENTTKLTVEYVNEKNEKVTIELNKGTDGWAPKAGTQLPSDVHLEAGTGKLTFTPDSIRDRSLIKAVGKNGDNPDSLPATHTVGYDGKSDVPSIASILNPDWLVAKLANGQPNSLYKEGFNPTAEQLEMQGGAYITPHANNTGVMLQFKDEDQFPRTVLVEKKANGEWAVIDSPKHMHTGEDGQARLQDSVVVDARTGKITLWPNGVADLSTVEVLGKNGDDPYSEAVRWVADPDRRSDNPEVIVDYTKIEGGAEPGSVAIKPHSRNTKEVISYINEDGVPESLVTAKEANGKWVFVGKHPAGVTLNADTGLVILPPDLVKDVDIVSARGTNGNNPESELVNGTSGYDAESKEPTIVAIGPEYNNLDKGEQGSVLVTPHEKNVRMTVRYENEAGLPKTVVIAKDKAGRWDFVGDPRDNGVSLNHQDGTVTIAAESIRDRIVGGVPTSSEVTASGQDGYAGQTANLNPQSPYARATPDNDKQSPAPEIIDGRDLGSAIIVPGAGNTDIRFTFTDENERTDTRTVTKNRATNQWSFEGSAPAGVTVDPETGRVTFEPNALKDGSQITVSAVNKNPDPSIDSENPRSEVVSYEAKADPTSATPRIIADGADQGGVKVSPDRKNEKVVVTYTDENGREQTVTIKKPSTSWIVEGNTPNGVSLNPANGELTIASDSLSEGTEVRAVGYNPNKDPASEPATFTALADKQTPAPNIGNASPQGSVSIAPVKPTNKQGQPVAFKANSTMEVKYTDEANVEHTIKLKTTVRQGVTTWTYADDSERPAEVLLEASTGKLTLPANSVLDQSKVKATAKYGDDPVSSETVFTADSDATSPPPTISALANGALEVKADPEDTFVKAKYFPEDSTEGSEPNVVAIAKDPTSGLWSFVNPENPAEKVAAPAGLEVDENNGVILFSPNSLKDESKVVAAAQKGNDPMSGEVEGTAGLDAKSEVPSVEALTTGPNRGGALITPDETNTKLKVEYVDETGATQTVKAEKGDSGWQITAGKTPLVDINPQTGAITLKPNAVEDFSKVKAVSQTHNDPESEERSANVLQDPASPEPTVAAGSTPGSVVITPFKGTGQPEDRPNTEMVIEFTDEQGQKQQVTTKQGENGTWTITSAPITGVAIDGRTGAVTLAPNAVQDGSNVIAQGKSGNDPISAKEIGQAPEDAKAQPPVVRGVETGDNTGAVEITPQATHTKMVINFNDETGTPQAVNAELTPTGWALKPAEGKTAIPAGVTIDRNGKVTIEPEAVEDRSRVTARGQTGNDPMSDEGTGRAPVDGKSPEPRVTNGAEEGSMIITPGRGNTSNTITFTDEGAGEGNRLVIHTKKVGNVWSFEGAAHGAQINSETGVVTLPPNSVKDSSEVVATGQNNTNPISDEAKGTSTDDARSPEPTITPINSGSEKGSVTIQPGQGNTKETIKYTNEDGDEKEITIVKNDLGVWAVSGDDLPTDVRLDRNSGIITLTPNSVQDGSTVTATGRNGNNPESREASGRAGEDAQSDRPTVTPVVRGSVVITPAAGNTENTITYRGEDGQDHTVKTKRGPDGNWTIVSVSPEDSGVSITPAGVVTLAPNSVEDGSTVKATGINGNNPVSAEATGVALADETSPPPVISAGKDQGSVVVTPHANNTKETFTYFDEADNPHTVELEKVDGIWRVKNNGTLPTGLELEDSNGAVTISPDSIKDGSVVTAFGQNGNNPVSATVTENAGRDANSPAPSVDPGTQAGSMKVTPDNTNTKEKITFTDEQGTQHVVLTEKVNNLWRIVSTTPAIDGVSINETDGVVTIAADSLADGSDVTAIGNSGNNPDSDLARGRAGSDEASPAPSVKAGTEPGSMVVTPDRTNTEMTLKFTTEATPATERSLRVVKEGDQWRFAPGSDQTGVRLDNSTGEVTIEPDSVRDTSLVRAKGISGVNPESAEASLPAPQDAKSPMPQMGLGTETGSVTITPVAGNTITAVAYTDEAGATQRVQIGKGADGRWTFSRRVAGVELDPVSGKITIPAEGLKDTSTVVAQSQNGNNPMSDRASIQAPQDARSPKPVIAANPAEKGSVTITPGAGNTTNEISYINEVDANRQTIRTAKNGNVWSFVGDSKGFTIDQSTGKVTIPANSLLDNSEVRATGINGNNPVSEVATGTAAVDAQSPAPTIANHATQVGAVTITPKAGNTKNTINYVDENNTNRVINTVKDGANWRFNGESFGASIDRNSGAVTIPAEGLKDGSRITATGQNGNDPVSTTTTHTAPDDARSPAPPVTPIATGTSQGAVEVSPANGNTRMTVTFTTEENTTRSVTAVKGTNNQWSFQPAITGGVTINPSTGKITIAPDSVKDGSTVTAVGQNGNNPESTNSTGTAPTDARSPKPTIENGLAQGSVDINPAAGNTTNTINFVDEQGNNRTITSVKNGNTWTLQGNTFGATINSTTGEVNIPAQSIKDSSAITATGQNGNNQVSEAATGTAPLDPKSPPPVIAHGTATGSITVTPVDGNTTMKVQYNDEQNRPQVVNIAKNAQGQWAFVGTPPTGTQIEAATGKVTLPALNVKDGDRVQAQAQNNNDPVSDWAAGYAGNNPIQANKLTIALNRDTGSSSTDRYTNDPKVFVDGVIDGQEWEYSINGGATWINGGRGVANQREFFTLPSNKRIDGVVHNIQARLKDPSAHAASLSDNFRMTLDQAARPTVMIDPTTKPTPTSAMIIGHKEEGSTLSRGYGTNTTYTTPIRYSAIREPGKYKEYGDMNYFAFVNDRNGINGAKVVEIDRAGNYGEAFVPTIKSLYHLKSRTWKGTDRADYLLLSRSANEGDGILKNANMDTGARVELGGGDDHYYMEGSMFANTYVDLGPGHDYFSVDTLRSPASPLRIWGGDGDDTVVIRQPYGARDYAVYGSNTIIDLGTGDDKLVVNGDANKFASPSAVIEGGSGYDTLIANARMEYQTNSNIEHREIHAIKNFEAIELRQAGHFLVDREFLHHNHDENGVFTVRGNGSTLHINGGYNVRNGVVENDGHTYKVVDSNGYVLLVEQGVHIV